MNSLTVFAPAKVNLTLDILGRRPDGFHNMEMVMQSVSLEDTITLELGKPGGIRAESDFHFLPNGKENLAVAAALKFRAATGQRWRDLRIIIGKKIPVCAGTAGGSSDAAAVLRGLNALTGAALDSSALQALAAEVGSDVPFCILGGTALAKGRGEVLSPLPPLPPCWIVLCKPRFSISTPTLFRAWDSGKRLRLRPDTRGMLHALSHGDLVQAARRVYNVFEAVLPPHQRREIEEIKNALVQAGALSAGMSGTGPTVLGIFPGEEPARQAVSTMKDTYREVFLTCPIPPAQLPVFSQYRV